MASGQSTSPDASPRFTRFSLATLFVVVTAIAVALAVGLEMTKSEVTAYVLIQRSLPDWPSSAGADMSDAAYRSFRQTQLELLRSEPLLIRAMRDQTIASLNLIHGQADPVKWLEANLKTDFPGDGELLRIRLFSRDPADAAKVVNAVVDSYFKEVVEQGLQQRNRNEERLRILYQELRDQIVREKKDVARMKEALAGAGASGEPDIDIRDAEIKRLEDDAGDLHARLLQLRLSKYAPPRNSARGRSQPPPVSPEATSQTCTAGRQSRRLTGDTFRIDWTGRRIRRMVALGDHR